MPRRSGKNVNNENATDKRLMYVLFILLLLLASLTIIQQPQDIRKRAQVTPTPLLRCGTPCTVNAQCPSQLVCFEGSCRNPECANKENCACTITPTPSINEDHNETLITPTLNPPIEATPTAVIVSQASQKVEKLSILQIFLQFVEEKVCQLFQSCR